MKNIENNIENMSLEEIEAMQKELERVKQVKMKEEMEKIERYINFLQRYSLGFEEYNIEMPNLEDKTIDVVKGIVENAFRLLKERVIDFIINQLRQQECDEFLTKELKEKYIKKLLEDKERKPEIRENSILGWIVDFRSFLHSNVFKLPKKDVYSYYLSNHIFIEEEQAKELLNEAISKIDFGIEVKTGELSVDENFIDEDITIVYSVSPIKLNYVGWVSVSRKYTDVYVSIYLQPYFASSDTFIKRCEIIEISGKYNTKTKKWEWI